MSDFFDVITRKQSYLNIIYSILSFPLALVYFVFAVTALSLGIGLIPIFVGIPVLVLTLLLCRKIMLLECILAEGLLHEDKHIADIWRNKAPASGEQILNKAKATLFNPDNWKAVFYIFIKFIYSTVVFTVSVTLVSVSAALVCAPFVFQILEESNIDFSIHYHSLLQYLGFNLTIFQESIVYMFVGLLLSVLTFHAINIMTYISGKLLVLFSGAAGRSYAGTKLHTVK